MSALTDWKLTPDTDAVLRGQGVDPEASGHASMERLRAAAQQALDLGLGLLHPIALTRTVAVNEQRHERILFENGAQLTGPQVLRRLNGAQLVTAAACTIGPTLEEEVARLFNQDSLLALALEGFGNAAVELLAQQVCGHIGDQAQAEGLVASTPISPGDAGWPVEIGQPQVFALLDPSEAGITLTSSGMMHPKKSITFVVGIGPAMDQTDLCQMCTMQVTCRYRHA